MDLINNIDEDIYAKVMENIKKALKNINEYDSISDGDHILINAQVHKSGKRSIKKKNKNKLLINKIPATVLANYSGGLLAVNIDIGNYELEKNEQVLVNYKLCNLISQEQWEILMKENSYKNKKNLKKKITKYRKYKIKEENIDDSDI